MDLSLDHLTEKVARKKYKKKNKKTNKFPDMNFQAIISVGTAKNMIQLPVQFFIQLHRFIRPVELSS